MHIYSLLIGLFVFGFSCQAMDPVTVKQVDLTRYKGLWFEVARLPNAFEDKESTHITATYSLNPDNTILVENACKVKGISQKAIGKARVTDLKTNAKLEVSFFSIFGFRPIWGDYWILALGDGPSYDFSVVGSKSRKYAWILSRTPTLNPTLMTEAHHVLTQNGYNIQKLIYPKPL